MKRKLITLRRIIYSGMVNFVRNISLAVAAIAVMVVTLTIVLFSIITNETFKYTIAQTTAKIDVSVFLQDSVTPPQTTQLLTQIKSLHDVSSVKYLSKATALQQYEEENGGNQQLQKAITETSNPLPATILIKPVNLNQIQSIKNFLTEPNIAAMQSDPPSYSGDEEQAINKITHATDVLRKVGVAAVIVFSVICALIIFNTIQMAIFNRRSEIQIMRLLGASPSYIRGPFIVESMIYGIVAAGISVGIIELMFITAKSSLQASTLGLLNIGYARDYFHSHLIILLLVQLMLGIVIGAVSSTIATRRYLKLKSKQY